MTSPCDGTTEEAARCRQRVPILTRVGYPATSWNVNPDQGFDGREPRGVRPWLFAVIRDRFGDCVLLPMASRGVLILIARE